MLSRTTLASLALVTTLAGPALAGQASAPRPTRVAAPAPATGPANTPFWTGMSDAAAFERAMTARLAAARASLAKLTTLAPPQTVEKTLALYNNIQIELDAVGQQGQLIGAVHPDEAFRTAADKASQGAESLSTELSLNRAVYDRLVAIDASKADEETRFYLTKTLRDFRLAGVDKDEATRARITALRAEIVLIGQEFDRNIRTDARTVVATSVADLDGLPADYISRHKPAADGSITLSIEYPDSLPVLSYAKNEALRKQMFTAYNNRAYPVNIAVLDKLIAKRAELAGLLGFPNWASYATADKMIGSAQNASDFIEKIAAAANAGATRDYATVLKRKQQDVPGATVVNGWERAYYAELVRKATYDFDSQSVRPYFAFDRVKQGLFDITGKLFGVSYRRIQVPVWDRSVEAYELLQAGVPVGRFYLDMHPRKDKYNHAAAFPIKTGLEDRQLPEGALICNLPGGEAGDPGLMTHADVETFFHEFGHLMHVMLAGHHQWVGIGGITTEWDFVEAPSQMLEEWTWDPATLATFAKHHQTNEPIPAALVKQMRRASEFGKALGVKQQMMLARLSLSVYDRDPKTVDTSAMVEEISNRYLPYPFVPGTHMQTSFGHLDGYSAIYYTYMWSLVIAKDLFSQFDTSNLLAPEVARKYRDLVLAPGGSKPAAELVRAFLGRSTNFAAWERWLNEER